MKTGKDFVLSLCDKAINILKQIMSYSFGDGNFVFPSPYETWIQKYYDYS